MNSQNEIKFRLLFQDVSLDILGMSHVVDQYVIDLSSSNAFIDIAKILVFYSNRRDFETVSTPHVKVAVIYNCCRGIHSVHVQV